MQKKRDIGVLLGIFLGGFKGYWRGCEWFNIGGSLRENVD